jgi:signal transduction histidine kinase
MQTNEGVLPAPQRGAAPAIAAPEREFRLVRYFTLTSLVAFAVVAAALGVVYRHLSLEGLLRAQEEANVNITKIVANELWASELGPFLRAMAGRPAAELRAAPQLARLHARVLALMRGSSAYKVKVYDLGGMTVYSTELQQIGEDKSGNAGVIAAAQGKVLSELVHRNAFSALEQEVLNRDLIQSYIPAYEQGRIAGVFEVYSDATPFVQEIGRKQWLVVGAVVGLLAALYLALFFVVRRAQDIIRRQSRARYREFIAQAAHELRTPLTSIYGFADLLKTRDYDRATVREVAGTIHGEAARLVELSNELLDLARLEARGAGALVRERQSIAPLIEQAAAALPPGDARRLQVRMEPGLPELALDRAKLVQALANVLSNACKVSAPGAPVTLEALRQDARVAIRVADRGIGMSPEELGHLFERFWRAEKVSEIPGSGLGLALAREIVQLHGGTIEVQSAPGQGTQVTIWLPC